MPKEPQITFRLEEKDYLDVKVAAAMLDMRGMGELTKTVLLAWLRGDCNGLPRPPLKQN